MRLVVASLETSPEYLRIGRDMNQHILLTCLGLLLTFTAQARGQDSSFMSRAHAHNDYYHKRPLLDAISNGFCSVEADVFLRKDELMVAHTFLEIRKGRTLKTLYLDPLFSRVDKNKGSVYKHKSPFLLLIDFKTEAAPTLKALELLLEPHRRHLTRLEKNKLINGPVTIVVSGNRPTKEIVNAKDRLVFLDGRLNDPKTWSAKVSPLVSESWNTHFRYRGFGKLDTEQKEKLDQIVQSVHQANKRIRFWALPDRQNGWQVAFDSGVDLINTDKLNELRLFLQKQKLGDRR